MSAINSHFRQMLNEIEQAQIGVTPNVPEDVRVMRLLIAYHKRGEELRKAVEAGNKLVQWCDEAKPLLERGGDFEKRAKQVARWCAEARAVEVVGGQHPMLLPLILWRFAQHLTDDTVARALCDHADKLQRAKLGHTGAPPETPKTPEEPKS